IGGDTVAEHGLADILGIELGATDRLAHDLGAELAGRNVLEAAAIVADRRAHAAQDDDFSLLVHVALRKGDLQERKQLSRDLQPGASANTASRIHADDRVDVARQSKIGTPAVSFHTAPHCELGDFPGYAMSSSRLRCQSAIPSSGY